MNGVRRFSLLTTVGLLGVAVAFGWVGTRPAMSASSATQLAAASAYFDSTIVLARNSRPTGWRGDALTIALGYAERLRLGLDSPFLLVDEALHDARLDRAMRSRVAWVILDRVRRGDAYVIDPAVLDGIGPWAADGHGATGAAHLALIDRAIRSAPDPRAGELAVRMAYQIEAGKGALSSSGVSIATDVAALLRDRESAEADLHELLADAGRQHTSVMTLIAARRAARSLRVERPALAPLNPSLRIEAMEAVPAIVRALDTLDRVDEFPVFDRASAPVIGEAFAARLRELGDRQPPVAPVVVMLRGHPHSTLRATNEETLAAAYVPLAFASDSLRRLANIGLVASAVALRVRAQDVPWFVGDPGPAAGEVSAEFGLADVKFARTVPSAWRPYYLRELQGALRDMDLVYPALSFAGLHITFGTAALPDSALAMHDPRSRTVELSIATSGGTLAHELSHDLDWQTAQRLFTVAGGYSTDRAATESRGALAASVRGLAAARVVHASRGADPSSDRPAELFARGSDWFTASVLAQQGRTDGFLTAVQDAMLPGYAAGAPTAVGVAGVESLTSAIDQMTFVPDSIRDEFTAQWADPNDADPALQVRRVMETPVSWRGTWHWDRAAGGSLPAPPAAVCIAGSGPEARARARLLMLAVDARAQGAALRRARYRPNSMRPETANGILAVGPWRSEPANRVVDALRSAIITDLADDPVNQGLLPVIPAIFRSSNATCSSISR